MTEESREEPRVREAQGPEADESPQTAAAVSAPPERSAGPDTAASADAPAGEAKPPLRQIKIGTQRPGTVAPKAKPLPLPAVAVKQAEPKKPAVKKRLPRPRPGQEGEAPQAAAAAAASTEAEPAATVAAPPPPPRDKVAVPSLREMSDELEQEIADALGEQSLDDLVQVDMPVDDVAEPELRSRRTGRIVAMHNDDVFIEFGQRHQGVVSMRQLPEPPAVGEEIEVVLAGFNAEEGLYLCAVPGAAMDVEDWSQLVEGVVIEVHVTGHNKGGLECQTHGIRGFIPAGQISLYRVEDFSEFEGQKLTCIVTEANERKQNLVLSRRAVLEREKAEAREKLMAELAPGQVRDGIVRKLMDFGAFVDIGGVDGLVHVSRISWGRVNHPSEVLKEGEAVRVRVEKVDPDTQKIGLSMRDLVESPWEGVERNYPQGTVIRGTVTKVMEFGAFVELEPGVEGLIHISELAHHRVFRVTDVAKEGEEVEAEVLSVDREKQRISLSMKAMLAGPVAEEKKDEPEESAEDAPRPKRTSNVPLQGGLGKSAGGEEFGLKW